MRLDGMIRTTSAPESVIQKLSDPAILARIAPKGCEIGEKAGGTVAFTIKRKLGPLSLTLPGSLSLHAKADNTWQVVAEAAHRIGGSVKVTLDVTGGRGPTGHPAIQWVGGVESHGLAARAVIEHGSRASEFVRNLFIRLRDAAEGRPAQKPGKPKAKAQA